MSLGLNKILIIRFSSFGDIVHCRAILPPLKELAPDSSVDWLVREDLKGALEGEHRLNHLIPFARKSGLWGLIKLAWSLRKEKYDLIYDAHTNLRSAIVRLLLGFFSSSQVIVRPKDRWKRFLLFKLGKNIFPKPFKGMVSYAKPLEKYLGQELPLVPIEWPVRPEKADFIKGKVILVPSAAWPLKRWPIDHWIRLVKLLPEHHFIILGGPEDKFCEDIARIAPERVTNWAGKLSLRESCAVAAHGDFVVTGDTGLQQVADLAGAQGVSLMGPTAFGFTTMGTLKTLEVDLSCRPCSKDGRGECIQKTYQKCMVDIQPEWVAENIKKTMIERT